jgi:hypothetical protein
MAIPAFDDNGNLPEGPHDATPEEIRETLVDAFDGSLTRRMIFEWWRHHRAAVLEVIGISEQWLGGSFASDKPDPNDLDLVMVIDGPTFDNLPRHRQLLIRPLVAGNYTEEIWRCDTYPVFAYPEGHPARDAYRVAFRRWTEHFGHDRDGNPRGFVRVAGGDPA